MTGVTVTLFTVLKYIQFKTSLSSSDGPMKIFLTCAVAYSRCPTARSRYQQYYIKKLGAQPVEKKCQDTTASETDARLQDCHCDYDNLGYALNR